jgi:hypothetical protein
MRGLLSFPAITRPASQDTKAPRHSLPAALPSCQTPLPHAPRAPYRAAGADTVREYAKLGIVHAPVPLAFSKPPDEISIV